MNLFRTPGSVRLGGDLQQKLSKLSGTSRENLSNDDEHLRILPELDPRKRKKNIAYGHNETTMYYYYFVLCVAKAARRLLEIESDGPTQFAAILEKTGVHG